MHPLCSLLSPFLIIFLLVLVDNWALLLSSAASDSLASGQSLQDGQTLISASQIFELGFFSPGKSSYRYVGIWYYNISEQTVVWVANREKAVEGSGGNLTIAANGNLELLDGSGNILWSSNIFTSSNSTTAKLQDSGNLVLQAGDGTELWQSFHHLSNTFLPGMILTLNMKNGSKQDLLTSWRSPVDPGVGKYSLGLDPSGSAQVFIWEGLRPWWRSGQWNGKTFIGTTMRSLNIYGFNLVVNNERAMSLTFTPANSSLLRFVLETDGVERTSMLVGESREWRSVWLQPSNACEYYGTCGAYSTCSNISTSAMCSCLQGFEPASSDEWSRGNWTRGCVRRTPLQCELNGNKSTSNDSIRNGDGFYRMRGVKLPDLSEWASVATDPTGCENLCMNNCSCKAYSYVDSLGCLVWGRYLIDIYQLPQEGNDLYIKLPSSELGAGGKRTWIIIVVCSILAAGLVMICIYLLWKYRTRIKDWWKKNAVQETLFSSLRFSRDILPEFSGPSEPGEVGEDGKLAELPLFTLDFMALATNDFSDSNKLGEGGFGLVYKGILPGGGEVAIKRLSRSSGQGLEEFKNEVLLIAKLQHRNLVRLLGCCIEGDEKMLVYEYMPNKSLDVLLFDPMHQRMLVWNKRFNIIEGIARGLVYLHRDSRLRIVHRDLKASNILLDEEMNPKISDFGMARIFGGDQNEANTGRLVGTYGYMSPEYAMEGLFSVKSDVYSFGVLVLEIVMGRKNSSFHHLEDSPNISGYVWPLWNEGRALDLVDPSIGNSCSVREALRCIHVGLLCVQDRANDRPDMSSVVVMLESDGAILQTPRRPTFASHRGPAANETCSSNDFSITVLSAR